MVRIKLPAIIIVFLGCAVLFLGEAGEFLVRQDPLTQSDVALVFSGDPDYERTSEAAKLYKDGWIKKLLLTGHGYGGDDSLFMKEVALSEGVSPRDIFVENRSTSTYTNLLYSRDIILSQGFTSVTLVSSPYHMKRIWTLTKRIFNDDGVKLYCWPARESIWNPQGWWKSAKGRKPVFQEYTKLLAFWIFGVLDQHEGGILWKSHGEIQTRQ